MLLAWGWRGGWVSWWATAPLLTLGLSGGAAILLEGVVRWHVGSALACLVAVTVPVAAVRVVRARRHVERARPRRGPPAPRALAPVVALATAVQLVALVVGMGHPGRLLTAFDVIFHLNGIEHVRQTGSASSLTFTAVSNLSDTLDGTFYGAAWHGVTALLPHVSDASTTFNLALLVPTALAWTLGLVFLTQAALPARPRAWTWAAAASVAGLGLPVYLALSPQGLVANAVGGALAPALIALVVHPGISPALRSSTLALAVLGIGLCHPNVLLACALVLLPWGVQRLAALGRRSRTTRWALLGGGAVAVCAVWATLARTGTYGRVAGVAQTTGSSPAPPLDILVEVVSGNASGIGLASGFAVGAAAIVGAVVGRRLTNARWALWGLGAAVAWFAMASSNIPGLRDVDSAWYGEPHRFAPVLAAMTVPLGALALDSGSRRLRLLAVRDARPRWIAVAVVGGLLLVSCAEAAVGTVQVARTAFADDRRHVADDAERDLLARLVDELPHDGAVLGSPFSGAAHLYALDSLEVVPRTWHTRPSAPLAYVMRHLDDLGRDDALCTALGTLGARYLYVDPAPWDQRPWVLDIRAAPVEGVRLLDSGGTASVYEITACP